MLLASFVNNCFTFDLQLNRIYIFFRLNPNELLDFYSGEEVMSLFKVKQSWLHTTAKRNRIPICRIAG